MEHEILYLSNIYSEALRNLKICVATLFLVIYFVNIRKVSCRKQRVFRAVTVLAPLLLLVLLIFMNNPFENDYFGYKWSVGEEYQGITLTKISGIGEDYILHWDKNILVKDGYFGTTLWFDEGIVELLYISSNRDYVRYRNIYIQQ